MIRKNGKLEKRVSFLLGGLVRRITFFLVVAATENGNTRSGTKNEPEILQALSKARKAANQFLTQAACVARGLPVLIDPLK